MFESFLAVPLHFTIEFLGFLIAAGGALLVLIRPNLTGEDPSNRGTVALGFGIGVLDTWATVSHAAKLAGFLIIGLWLWTSVRSSLRIRFVASFVALLVVVVLALSTALTGVISSNVEAEEEKRVVAELNSAVQNINGLVRDVNDDTKQLAGIVQDEVANRANLKATTREVI